MNIFVYVTSIKKELKKSYLRFVQKIQVDLTSNPTSFWYYIKSLKVDNDIPNTMVLNDKSSTGGYAVAELSKEFFSSVYSTNSFNINEHFKNLKNYTDICQ